MTFTVTVDVEDIKNHSLPSDIYLGPKNCGIPYIARFLHRENVSAIFFLDTCYSLEKITDKIFQKTIKISTHLNHEIGLHIHPRPDNHPSSNKQGFRSEAGYLSLYSLDESLDLITRGKNLLENETGRAVPYFRSGSYAINQNLLKALPKLGFTQDHSIFWGYSNALKDSIDYGNLGKFQLHGIHVVPVTSFLTKLPFVNSRIRKKIDPSWVSISEFEKYLKVIPQSANFEFFLHSYSFIDLQTGKANIFAITQFKKMLKLAKEYGHIGIKSSDLQPSRIEESEINISFSDYNMREFRHLILPRVQKRNRSVRFLISENN
jgi:hypothetical protein